MDDAVRDHGTSSGGHSGRLSYRDALGSTPGDSFENLGASLRPSRSTDVLVGSPANSGNWGSVMNGNSASRERLGHSGRERQDRRHGRDRRTD